MGNKIFYFTGTGNSIAIAKTLADSLGDTELIPMASAMHGDINIRGERIGLVFPVYAWGMPRLVVDFARHLKPEAGQYVFAVTTCGGTLGKTLVQLDKALQLNGSKLNAGFAVRGSFLISLEGSNEEGLINFMSWLGRKTTPDEAENRLPEIARIVKTKGSHKPETSNASVNVIGSMLYGFGLRMFQKMDKNLSATDACVSCGTCVRVCPRENVSIENGRPVWHQDCESCYACVAWCPQHAIVFNGKAPKLPAHHPDVSVADVMLR
ncbi:EFR1 family ferrodoxin [Candidatus Bipolaricaulota bacterium]|nr:EFR1 family ferrodoxin [Candidatus Bipolaricaulota bacterium]